MRDDVLCQGWLEQGRCSGNLRTVKQIGTLDKQVTIRKCIDGLIFLCAMLKVVRIARRVLALPLVNIGGIDIVNGQHKLLLAILWQLMRYNIRGLLQANCFLPHTSVMHCAAFACMYLLYHKTI